MADKATIFDSGIAHFRLAEAGGKPDPTGLAIDVHIISPGWGSSGYYSESVLKAACQKGVYPEGMHMHWDHPTVREENEQPARTLQTLVGVLTESGHYEADGWDKTPENPTGAGVYSKARIFPQYRESIREMGDSIGISHYVSGRGENGVGPDGKKGRIIRELLPDPFNTVDFVTVPGAGGHYRTLFTEMKARDEDPTANGRKTKENHMAGEGQETLTLSEIRTKFPEVVAELRKQLAEELKIEVLNEEQKKKLTDAQGKVRDLEKQLAEARALIAEAAARKFVEEQVREAKIPETSGKALVEHLAKQPALKEDGEIDTVKFGEIVTESIKSKKAEIEAILKESGRSGIRDGGSGTPPAGGDVTKAREALRDSYLESGKTLEEANRLAGIRKEA